MLRGAYGVKQFLVSLQYARCLLFSGYIPATNRLRWQRYQYWSATSIIICLLN